MRLINILIIIFINNIIMNYRIRIFSSFCNSLHGKNVYEKIFETHKMINYGPDKEIYITIEDDYTHVIIWNTAMPKLLPNIPKENIIGLAYEPPAFLGINQQFIEYAQKYINKYFIGDVFNLPKPFIGYQAYLSHITPLLYIPKKQNLISIMISQKISAPGHKYRHQLVEEILKTNLPIDIYGKGCQYYNNINDTRLKGTFEELEPYESYKYHICIENYQTSHYYSEKIINTLLCETIPIYLGCHNINIYFPEMVHCLSGDVEKDLILLQNIVNEPNKYIKNINIENVKQQTNLLKNIKSIFTFA